MRIHHLALSLYTIKKSIFVEATFALVDLDFKDFARCCRIYSCLRVSEHSDNAVRRMLFRAKADPADCFQNRLRIGIIEEPHIENLVFQVLVHQHVDQSIDAEHGVGHVPV